MQSRTKYQAWPRADGSSCGGSIGIRDPRGDKARALSIRRAVGGREALALIMTHVLSLIGTLEYNVPRLVNIYIAASVELSPARGPRWRCGALSGAAASVR